MCVASDKRKSVTMKRFSQICHSPNNLIEKRVGNGFVIIGSHRGLIAISSGCDLFKVLNETSGIVDTGASRGS